MKRLQLLSPLWIENARAAEAQKIAESNRRHRRAFPWLFIIAALAMLFLFHWLNS